MTLEELVVKITGETSGLKNAMSSAVSAVGKFSAAAVAAGATAAAAITKSAVESYADYEQLVGGVETLFKDSAGIVQEYAANAFQTAGLSANDYMETVTGFSASLLQSVGGDTEEAARIADMAITDMADNANKMGTSMESIQNAYQGFAKQNYTMLDNLKLGYGGTKEEMKRLLEDAEKLSGIHYDISNLNDVYSAIHVIQEELDITGTTAKEASTTIQGSAAAMKAAWQNMLVGIADENADFDTLINNLVESVSTFGENILPRIEIALKGVGKLISGLAPVIVEALPNLLNTILPEFINAVMSIVDSIIAVLPELLPTLIDAAVDILMQLIEALAENLPTIIEAILEGLNQIIEGITENLPTLIEAVVSCFNQIIEVMAQNLPTITQSIVDGLITMVQAIIDNLPQFLQAFLTLMLSFNEALIQALPQIIEALPQLIEGIINFIIEAIPMLIDAYIQLMTALIEALPDIIEAISEALPELIDGIIDGILTLLPKIIECGIQLFIALIQNIGDIIAGIAAALPDLINGIIQAILEHLPEIIECGVKLFVALVENLPKILIEILKAVAEILSSILGAINDGFENMAEAGLNLVKGLWQGIKDAAGWLKDKISGWVDDVMSAIKGFFGIASPSKLTAEDGKYLAMGLGKGITDNIKYATDAVKDMGTAVEAAFNPNLKVPEVESDMGLSNVRLRASITPTLTDATGLEIDSQNKLEAAFRNGNSDIISTLIQTTQQLIQAIEDKDTSLSIGDDVIANAAARGNNEYRRRTGKPLLV